MTESNPHMKTPATATKKRRRKCKYEKALRELVDANQRFMRWIDAEMLKPSSLARGQRVAEAINALGVAVDSVRFFTLGVDYRNDKNPTFKSQRNDEASGSTK